MEYQRERTTQSLLIFRTRKWRIFLKKLCKEQPARNRNSRNSRGHHAPAMHNGKWSSWVDCSISSWILRNREGERAAGSIKKHFAGIRERANRESRIARAESRACFASRGSTFLRGRKIGDAKVLLVRSIDEQYCPKNNERSVTRWMDTIATASAPRFRSRYSNHPFSPRITTRFFANSFRLIALKGELPYFCEVRKSGDCQTARGPNFLRRWMEDSKCVIEVWISGMRVAKGGERDEGW